MAERAARARLSHARVILAWGVAVAALLLLLDQLSKWWVRDLLGAGPPAIEVAPFFNLVLVWNRGISFGLLDADSETGPWLFSAIGGAVSLGLLFWLTRLTRRWMAIALGLVLGGALGNVIDRLRFRAVVDFLDFHLAGYHWPAFNLADAGISAGIVFLAIDALLRPRKRPK